MKFFGRRKTFGVTMLDFVALSAKLQEFEDENAVRTGQRVPSAEFHDRYLRGEADLFVDAIEWATYYELYRAHGRQALHRQTNGHQVSLDEIPVPFAIAQ